MDKYLDIALRSLKDRADKYDKARTEVKIDGGTRAHYIIQRDTALEEVERLRTLLRKVRW